MEIIAAQDLALLAWAQERLGARWEADQVRWLSGVADGLPVFVVLYSRFSERNCELSIATDMTKRWATRRALRAIFHVPFRQWQLRRVTFVINAENKASIDLCERLGAVHEGRVRKSFPGDADGLVLGILKEECKWC